MISLLNESARGVLFDVYADEFDSALPHQDQANIVAVTSDDGDIEAFITAEVLIRVGMLWVRPDMRGTPHGAKRIRQLCRYLKNSIPAGSSVVAIGYEDAQKQLFKRMGMRHIEGDVYRIDL